MAGRLAMFDPSREATLGRRDEAPARTPSGGPSDPLGRHRPGAHVQPARRRVGLRAGGDSPGQARAWPAVGAGDFGPPHPSPDFRVVAAALGALAASMRTEISSREGRATPRPDQTDPGAGRPIVIGTSDHPTMAGIRGAEGVRVAGTTDPGATFGAVGVGRAGAIGAATAPGEKRTQRLDRRGLRGPGLLHRRGGLGRLGPAGLAEGPIQPDVRP